MQTVTRAFFVTSVDPGTFLSFLDKKSVVWYS